MANTENKLTTLYADLNRLGQKQEYEKALKVANKIIAHSSTEDLAIQCKIVCLIQLNKFEEVLVLLKKNPQLTKKSSFEKAYCEYRLNRTSEALETLRSCAAPDLRINELLSQVLYRLESYEECCDLYKEVIKNSHDDFDEEREVNLTAAMACMSLWENNVSLKEPALRLNTYELCYNRACYLIGQGDRKKAQEILNKAANLCRESLEDDPDMTEEDIDSEMAIIRLQLAYLKQCMGQPEEAMQLYNMVLKRKPTDVGLVAVASNNVVSINKEQNIFDSKKKMRAATTDAVRHKLSSKQRQLISFNQCLLHLFANQLDQCRHLTAKVKADYPQLEGPVLIDAALHIREKQPQKAIEALSTYCKSHRSSLNAKLSLAQLHLTQGNVKDACEVLASLGELSHKPGIASVLVALYQSLEDSRGVMSTLTKSISWYKKHEPSNPYLVAITRTCANHYMKAGNYKQAAEMLEHLPKLAKKDPQVIAMLITAYSQTDPHKAEIISRDLPSMEDLASTVDVDELEASLSSLVMPKYKKVAKDSPLSPAGAGDAAITLKKKRRKKAKFSKNFNPDVPIDAERWLPRQERSYYRGKRRDKRKGGDIGRGTQGSTNVTDGSETKQTTKGSEPQSPAPQPVTQSPNVGSASRSAHKMAAAQKKRKKKGKGYN